MGADTYKALVVKEKDGHFIRSIQQKEIRHPEDQEILIRVHYSSLNYKDALSATGNKGVTKTYPHTPGIDAAGEVIESCSDSFAPGDMVIATGYDLGMNTPGGWGEYIRIPAEWAVKLPEGLTPKEAMIIGTAGFTAGISISRFTELVKPDDGYVLVSGATGGVGSVALSILSKLSYQTIAISGKTGETDYLKSLGATDIIPVTDFRALEKKPILSAKYAGGIDTVGGVILENMIKSTRLMGAITTCGSVAGTELNISVFPFILRGITLIGISAQNYPAHLRPVLWQKLAGEWKSDKLLSIYNEITLNELNAAIDSILKGQLKGRTIINLL